MEKYKEAKAVAIEFETELRQLLIKWNAEIMLEDIGKTYFTENIIKCYIPAIYNDLECISEFTEINLGTYIS